MGTTNASYRTAECLADELAERRHDAVARLFASVRAKPPLVLWSPLAEQLGLNELKRFHRHISTLAHGEGLPLARAFKPQEAGPLAPWLMRLTLAQDDGDLRYDYYGAGIVDHFGRDMTGHSVFDFGGHISTFFAGLYLAALRRRELVYSEHEPPPSVFVRNWQRLLVPLVDEANRVVGFAGCNLPENPLRAGLDILPDPAFVFDDKRRIRFANKPAMALLKFAVSPAGLMMDQLLEPKLCQAIADMPDDGTSYRCNASLSKVPGRHFELAAGHVPQAGQILWVVTLRDITRQIRSERKVKRLAETDTLTTLGNRRMFENDLKELIGNSTRFAMFLIDLNGFKSVNDRYGHWIGDQLLKAVAKRIRARCRRGACVARIGGDEFAVLIPGIADQGAVDARRQSLATAFDDPYRFDDVELTASAGIGVALFPGDAEDRDTLFQIADRDLYSGKRTAEAPK